MATRTGGIHRVRLYNAGARYACQYQGVGQKFKIPDLHKWKKLGYTTFDASALNLVGPDATNVAKMPTVSYVDLPEDRGFLIAAPYLDGSQQVGLSTYWQTTNGEWEDLEDPDYPNGGVGRIIMQRDATEGVTVTAESKFHLPPNPIIALSLWRGEPCADEDRLANQTYTRIGFGHNGNQFALVIPYGGFAPWVEAWNPFLNSNAGGWVRLNARGNGNLPALDGISKGERIWIIIGIWMGAVCISFKRGQGSEAQWVVFPIPDQFWDADSEDGEWSPINNGRFVREGPLRIVHNGGQIAFRWWPIYMPSTSKAWYNGEVEAWYRIWDTTNTPAAARMTAATWDIWRQRVWDEITGTPVLRTGGDVTVTGYNVSGSTSASTYSWYASWSRVAWSLLSTGVVGAYGGSGIAYYSSPILAAVQCRIPPYIYDATSWPDYTDISTSVKSVRVEFSEDNRIGTARLTVENYGAVLRTAKANQMITVELGYTLSDSTNTLALVFCGYIADPGRSAAVGPEQTATLVAYGPLIRLRDSKAFGCEPDMQWLTAKGAAQWLCWRAGIATAQQSLLGSDDVMTLGEVAADGSWTEGATVRDPANDTLVPAFGTTLLDSISEYCLRDAKSEWYWTCDSTYFFIVRKTNGALTSTDGTLYTLKEDTSGVSTEYALRHVETDAMQMDPGQYADTVVIMGRTAQGETVLAMVCEDARISDPSNANWSGGWHHVHCEARDNVQTAADATLRAQGILAVKRRRADLCTAHTDLIVPLLLQDRFTITNDSAPNTGKAYNAGALDVTYRVSQYVHVWERESWPRTEVTGRSLA